MESGPQTVCQGCHDLREEVYGEVEEDQLEAAWEALWQEISELGRISSMS